MKLAIADPPYLGRGKMLYGGSDCRNWGPGPLSDKSGTAGREFHPKASEWDDPEQHRRMVDRLIADYDGWVIALARDNVWDYAKWVPRDTRIASWHKVTAPPGGARVITVWEPALVFIPHPRRARGTGAYTYDIHTAPAPRRGFIGAKPASWTRWVLDMLGYDPETDTVDDLFAGSGAVAAEIAQGVLL